jgi:hypothetical protein
VLARIIEPASKQDSLRVLEEFIALDGAVKSANRELEARAGTWPG